MSAYVVLRRASENTWEARGMVCAEKTLAEAEGEVYALAAMYPHDTFAIAEIQTIYATERTVSARPASKPITKIERKAS